MRVTTGFLLIGLAVAATAAQAQTPAPAAAPAPTSLTEEQARSIFLGACSNVSTLSQDSQGLWHGVCSRGPRMINADGKVVADTAPAGEMTEAQARAVLLGSCSNVSTLHKDINGNWHGTCSKGAMMVDAEGKAVKYTYKNAGITGPHARSLAMSKCSNVSQHIHMDAEGTWSGRCSKGVWMVNQEGEISFKK